MKTDRDLAAEIDELKAVVMSLTVLSDVKKIAIPVTQHAPGSATVSKRDWSKVPTAKLQELAAKTFSGSPKNNAVRAELTARGIE